MENNIFDTSLVLEGGGMRCSFTAGALNALLDHHMYFQYVSGISAGSTNGANYISRDEKRIRDSYLELSKHGNFAGVRYLLKGQGFFNSEYLYRDLALPDGDLPFDFEAFQSNPADFDIGAFEVDSGKLRYFSREDYEDLEGLLKVVEASSALPIFMPMAVIDGKKYVDGGVANGIPLDIAEKRGYKKHLIILSRPRGFRRRPYGRQALIKMKLRKFPRLIRVMLERHVHYNKCLDYIEELEEKGEALVLYPEVMPYKNTDTNPEHMKELYEMGYRQMEELLGENGAFFEKEDK